jgi:cytochrome bd ubiquinol oxidase subunit II
MRAGISAGSVPLPRSLASDASATLWLAPLGWSRNAKGEIRNRAYRQTPYLAVGVLIFLAVVFIYALAENFQILGRWLERPYLFVFPALGAVALAVMAAGIHRRRDGWPFPMVTVIFASAFGTLAISFRP